MKSIRIIARLDIKGPNVVKGIQTEGLYIVGLPEKLAFQYYIDGIDEILYMDTVASLYDRNLDFQQLKLVCEKIYIPVTVGGGIRSLDDINDALRAGADKVAINTFAVSHPEFIDKAVRNFGSQCIVLSVEAKKIRERKWEVYTEGGRERTFMDVIDWIKKAIGLGVGEIVITSIDRDGTKKGYDLDLINEVSCFSPVPVIAHGGAGTIDHMSQAILEGKSDAVSISSILHYGERSILEIKRGLEINKIQIRSL